MGRKNGFFILSIFVLLVAGPAAYGQNITAQFGLLYGLSVPDAENTNPYYMYGFKGAAKLAPWFSTGGYFLVSDKTGQPSSTEKFKYSLAGVAATYHYAGGTGDMWTSLRMGITKINSNPNGTDSTFSPYHYGIATGYDYKLFYNVIIGFEGSYIHVQTGKTTQNAVTILQDSFNIMSFLATLQFSI